MLAADVPCPFLKIAVAKLDDLVAAGAGQVVMVPGGACPVARFAAMVEAIDYTRIGEGVERAVDRGKSELGVPGAQPCMQGLCRCIPLLPLQRFQHGQPLSRGADASAGKRFGGGGCLW